MDVNIQSKSLCVNWKGLLTFDHIQLLVILTFRLFVASTLYFTNTLPSNVLHETLKTLFGFTLTTSQPQRKMAPTGENFWSLELFPQFLIHMQSNWDIYGYGSRYHALSKFASSDIIEWLSHVIVSIQVDINQWSCKRMNDSLPLGYKNQTDNATKVGLHDFWGTCSSLETVQHRQAYQVTLQQTMQTCWQSILYLDYNKI